MFKQFPHTDVVVLRANLQKDLTTAQYDTGKQDFTGFGLTMLRKGIIRGWPTPKYNISILRSHKHVHGYIHIRETCLCLSSNVTQAPRTNPVVTYQYIKPLTK